MFGVIELYPRAAADELLAALRRALDRPHEEVAGAVGHREQRLAHASGAQDVGVHR